MGWPKEKRPPRRLFRLSTEIVVVLGLIFLAVGFVLTQWLDSLFRLHTVQVDILREMPLWATSDCPLPSQHLEPPDTVKPMMARAFAVHYAQDERVFHVVLPDGRTGYLCDDGRSLAEGDGTLPEEIW